MGQTTKTAFPAVDELLNVPVTTPMFDGTGIADGSGADGLGNLTRTWILFFQGLIRKPTTTAAATTTAAVASGWRNIRTLLIYDTATGDHAPHLTIQQTGIPIQVSAVLRKPIASTLRVRFVLDGVNLIICDIPGAYPVDTAILFSPFLIGQMAENQVLSAVIDLSDGSTDAGGVASLTIEWSPDGA